MYWHDISHDALITGIAHTYKSPYRIAARRLLHCAHFNAIELSGPSFWETWGSRVMVKHILTLPVGFCKESQFPWKYTKPNHYPPQLRDFIHRALWGKLSREDIIQPPTGHIVGCPICGADEDNLHFLFHCSLMKVAADCIDKALGSYIDVHGLSRSNLQLASTHEGETLATLPGKVLWTARQAMLVTRCLFCFNALPDTRKYHTLLSVWARKLMEVAKWPGAIIFSSYFRSVRYAILELLNIGTLVPRIFMGDWFFTQQGNKRSKRRKLNK